MDKGFQMNNDKPLFQTDDTMEKYIKEAMEKHAMILEDRIITCIVQAIKCGDFYIHCQSDLADKPVYEPYRKVKELEERIKELENDLWDLRG